MGFLDEFLNDNVRFRGVCPSCGTVADFKDCRKSQNVGFLAHGALNLLVNPLGMIGRYITQEKATLARCMACDEPALQCPRCGAVNRREYAPTGCIHCGKAYIHP